MFKLLGNENILIVRLGKIGDIIVTSFVFDVIKKRYPNVSISLLTLSINSDVLKYNASIDNKFYTRKNLSLYFRLIQLRRKNFDMLIDLNDDPSKTSELIRRFIRVKTSAGFSFPNINEPDIAIDRPPKNESHIIDRIRLLLSGLNINVDDNEAKPKLVLGKNENQQVINQLDSIKNNSKIVAINLSAGADIRIWSAQKWIKLLQLINDNYDGFIFLLLSEHKNKILRETIGRSLPQGKWIEQLYDSFQYYASYICNANFLITADTSAVHIAASFDIPVLALYPNYEWNFVSWQPLSEHHRSIRSISESIEAIPVDDVFNSFVELQREINI